MTFFLINLGCQMNLSDSERIRTVLNTHDYRETYQEQEADILGLMACSVRQRTIDRAYSIIHKWNIIKKQRPVLTFVSGCILPKDREEFVDRFDMVFSINELHTLPSLIQSQGIVLSPPHISIDAQETLSISSYSHDKPHNKPHDRDSKHSAHTKGISQQIGGYSKEAMTHTSFVPIRAPKNNSHGIPPAPTRIKEKNTILNLSKVVPKISQTPDHSTIPVSQAHDRESHPTLGDYFWKTSATHTSNFEAYVPIQNGCDKFCTFCAVPYTRGREVSRPSDDIFGEIQQLLEQGYKSITLLGQNVNSYGLDNNNVNTTKELRFPQLLARIGAMVDDYSKSHKHKCLVYFTSPHPRDMTIEVLSIIGQHDSLAKQIHLPLQSADDKVLFKMNRNHSFSKYMHTIDHIKTMLPQASIFTDIIVGFCGETEPQFKRTADAMNTIGFAMAYIAQYSPRPGAASYRWPDDVPASTKKERFKILSEILHTSAQAYNTQFIGSTIPVLIEGIDRKGTSLIGRTEQKIPCLITIPETTQTYSQENAQAISREQAQHHIGEYRLVTIQTLHSLSLRGYLKDSPKNMSQDLQKNSQKKTKKIPSINPEKNYKKNHKTTSQEPTPKKNPLIRLQKKPSPRRIPQSLSVDSKIPPNDPAYPLETDKKTSQNASLQNNRNRSHQP